MSKKTQSVSKAPEAPKPIVPVVSLTLNLTERDAQNVMRLCSHVGGTPDISTRHVFDLIYQKLRDAGFKENMFAIPKDSAGLYFKDYPVE